MDKAMGDKLIYITKDTKQRLNQKKKSYCQFKSTNQDANKWRRKKIIKLYVPIFLNTYSATL